tara:strand:+ start:2019 stop:4991 length:2973 start_codon:yes stop_codon:yes gene_type:complete
MATLTLQDIKGSATLQQLGALAGDKIDDDGTLTRVFSSPEDEQGEQLTYENIQNSKTLQSIEAEVGDRIAVDGTLIKTKQDDAWRAYRYGKAKGEQEGATDYATDILTQHFPTIGVVVDYSLGKIADSFPDFTSNWATELAKHNRGKYQSPNEKFGEGFTEATPDVRRDMMLRQKERSLQKQFKGYIPEGGFAQGLGELWGTLKDPTSLIPAGQGIKATMALGAGVAGSFSMLQDEATKGEINLPKAGLFAAGGAVIPTALIKGTPAVAKGVSSLYTKATSAKTVKKSQALIAKRQSEGIVTTDEHLPEIAQSLKISPKRLVDSYSSQKVKPRFHSSTREAEKALQASIAEDSSMLRTISKEADHFLGSLSTRIKNIDDGLFGKLMKTEYGLHKNTQQYLKTVDPFVREVSALPQQAQDQLNYFLRKGDFDAAENWMTLNAPDLVESFGATKGVLKDIGTTLQKFGHKADVENYFPTNVKNHANLRNGLGLTEKNALDDALIKAAEKKNVKTTDLTDIEKDRITESVLKKQNFNKFDALPTNLKERRLIDSDMNVELMGNYKNPAEALQTYIRSSVNNIERKKFFGNSVVHDAEDAVGMNVKGSITAMVNDLNKSGKLTASQVDELTEVLGARFASDGGMMHGGLTTVKNLGYIGTLGDFMSTLTQVADVPNVMGYHGFGNTLKSAWGLKGTLIGKNGAKGNYGVDDVGMADSIARELGDAGKFSSTLNTLLKVTGFKKIDRFGKETLMNAVRNKYTKQLNPNNVKGVNKFKEKWKNTYGPETDQLILDLQKGDKTELTNLHMFTKLSEHQPISYSEYPAAYMNNPNGRILYMLKSFTLKQWDLVRRNLYQEFKKAPNKKAKAKVMFKAGKVAGFVATGGLGVDKTKDWIMGRDIDPADLGTDALWALAGAYGINKYSSKFLKQGDVAGFADNLTTIPVPVFQGIQALMTGDMAKVSKSVPIVGRTLHSRAFGGADKYNKKKRRERFNNR